MVRVLHMPLFKWEGVRFVIPKSGDLPIVAMLLVTHEDEEVLLKGRRALLFDDTLSRFRKVFLCDKPALAGFFCFNS